MQPGWILGLVPAAGRTLVGAPASCEERKAELAAKLDATGVKACSLEIVATARVGDRPVIGSCEGGTQKIVYTRSAVAP